MCTNLKRLSLSSNRLKTLPDDLSSLQNLLALHMQDNELENGLPFALRFMTSLQILHIGKNTKLGKNLKTKKKKF